jgi:hypothetical protein
MKFKMINGLPRLTVSGIVINNGVKIKREFVFPNRPITFLQEVILALRSSFNKHSINGNFEAGVYLSHLRVTRPNDKVLAVGLGSGSTLISVVKLMEHSSGGFYRCIEASESQIEIAKENIGLNNLDSNKYKILNAFAGDEVFGSYGESSKNNIDINNFDFDVLEMDCEGSELSILSSLTKRPRNIIVELHPRHFPHEYKDFDVFLNLMETKGYKYQFAYGHNGDYLDIEYARKYYNSTNFRGNNESCIEDRSVHFFGACPIVVTFIYDSITKS